MLIPDVNDHCYYSDIVIKCYTYILYLSNIMTEKCSQNECLPVCVNIPVTL